MKINKKAQDNTTLSEVRLAGGFGVKAAKQDSESLLRRAVLSCMLFEDLAYESGKDNADNIANLIPQVAPEKVAEIAVEARLKSKLRHVPLYMISEMARYKEMRPFLRETINKVVTRADQITDLIALYYKDGRKSMPNQMKKGLADAFNSFNQHSLARYKGLQNKIKLRDALRIVHPTPKSEEQSLWFKQLDTDTLPVPETRETLLSQAKTSEEKKKAWEYIIQNKRITGLGFLKSLKHIKDSGVSDEVIMQGFKNLNMTGLLPLNFFAAAKYVPQYQSEIEEAMFRAFSDQPKLSGTTVFVIDVSGSMQSLISSKSEFTRTDAAFAMAVMGREVSERAFIYATAGNDSRRIHATERVKSDRGFALSSALKSSMKGLGGGGIFTRQSLKFIKKDLSDTKVDRIIVFSDSQDCDSDKSKKPNPFGMYNYICDVSSHKHGINYEGVWNGGEISGFSENFLSFIAASEGLNFQIVEED